MKSAFVDANVFLRLFTQDVSGQYGQALRLFKEAKEGEIRLVTGPPVLFEVAWTLKSAYGVSRERILLYLSIIGSFPNLHLLDRAAVVDAIQLARKRNMQFADAYIAVSASRAKAEFIATFNVSDFKNLETELYSW